MVKFSIIVPVYNVEEYLAKCLDSLLIQKPNNYEIIIVNDGSTDNCQNIIDEYTKNNSKVIKAFTKKNGGLSSARNFGLKKAQGEYIMFVDSDDYIADDTIKILTEAIDSTKADIIMFKLQKVKDDKLVDYFTFDTSIKDKIKRYIISSPSACAKIYSKKIFDNFSFIDNVYYEDLSFSPKLISITNKIEFINKPLYYYVERTNSIMREKKYNKKMEDIFFALNEISDYYKANNLMNKYRDELEFLYIEHLLRGAGLRFISYKKFDLIDKIVDIMNEKYPNWRKNKYYCKLKPKQKLIRNLIYYKLYFTINILMTLTK